MSLESDIAAIEELPKEDLVERWRLLYGKEPPAGLSVKLMRGALIYDLQARRHGDLSSRTRTRLQRIATRLEKNPDRSVLETEGPSPGTRLTRDWHGSRHVVEVLSDGYAWQGATYASLSEIARRITGARWSGPRFFGLKTRRKVA
ncbi:DUF2924 domain-containing protein [Parvularcula flava]|uniref:DUF2924 domain-containing protein n=1 Tax=Aquisalinus luteolus TaxID=1566827 RepID=A0A8J3EPZ3_9PROT|nr:DUF2924 domain-containing protein [Aquisalinus luteolus]NHK26374.1 DUF2924 domain-containing protein [Aquisalinus luteolus]GGH92142.1 hypothetical protein GCM10011355_00940 [Aquisalinus luteolus]